MGQGIPSADELRSVAVYLDEAASNPTVPADAIPTLEIGDAQNFPREAPTARAVGQGIAFTQEMTRQAGARLLELAAIMDAGEEVTPEMLAPLQLYIDAYREEQKGQARGRRRPRPRGSAGKDS
jgi:hypothetical protein